MLKEREVKLGHQFRGLLCRVGTSTKIQSNSTPPTGGTTENQAARRVVVCLCADAIIYR